MLLGPPPSQPAGCGADGTGLSEHRMGMALRTYPRDSYVLSTKVGYFLRPDVGGVRPSPPSN